MQASDIRSGMRIKTNDTLGTTEGFTIHEQHLKGRVTNTEGVVTRHVPGHGGDVWFVRHNDGSIAAYADDEFELSETP